jgi:UDP-N-acetylmuramate--alanine ligase
MGLIPPVEPVPLSELGRVHFIGIAGVGMSGVARVMLARGVKVSGSDTAGGGELTALAGLGATVYPGQAEQNLDGADTVVVSTAIRPGNIEVAGARRRGLRVVHRAGALGSLMLDRQAAAVAGTHGKTTTTAMLTTVLRRCGADPGYVIGGILAETGICAADGAGKVIVVEADESDGSFLMLPPSVAVVTCVEADHLDNYASLAEIQDVFASFARRIRPGGVLVACADDPGARALAAAARHSGVRVRTYGESAQADYRVTGIAPHGMRVGLRVEAGSGALPGVPPVTRLEVGAPGRHNALNATAAYAAALELGMPADRAAAALATYQGALRRMEPKGEAAGVAVLDSYAHHPTELAADLRAAREIRPDGRVIAVFQPHLYSRTRIFAAEFGAVLGLADEVIVLDVYGAREDPEPGVTGQMVSGAVPGGHARYLPDRQRVPAAAAALARPGDLILTMGAGDVTSLGPQIVAELAERTGVPGD